MIESTSFTIEDVSLFKQKALVWATQFDTVCYLDSNQYTEDKYSQYDCLIGVDSLDEITAKSGENAFTQFYDFQEKNKDEWLFGHFSYDLKNEVEELQSSNHDGIGAPDLFFFRPRYLIFIKENKVTFNRNYPESFFFKEQIENTEIPFYQQPNVDLKSRVTKEEYFNTVEKIRRDIEEGTVYEMNYCKEYFAENVSIDSAALYLQLNQKTQSPFSTFLKYGDIEVLCTSPERFIQKKGSKLISQPIKGTIRKSNDKVENKELKNQLYHDEKERAENVMIVDLVRHDLTKSAEIGSVKVKDLFGIYGFQTVNHMISTIAATVKEGLSSIDVIKNAFPMGSMTGAPKVKATQLIEEYEATKRGIYSGSIGYFSPNGDFDFNVAIRTLVYNKAHKYLSLQVGGAITYDSIPEKEWEETQIKIASIRKEIY